MKAAMIGILSMMLSLGVSAAMAETHVHGAKADKVQSLGGGKKCEKCDKNKGGAKGDMMEGCCCKGMMGKMDMMSGDKGGDMGMMHGGMDHDAMAERMQKMEARMDMMQKMMEQMSKGPAATAK